MGSARERRQRTRLIGAPVHDSDLKIRDGEPSPVVGSQAPGLDECREEEAIAIDALRIVLRKQLSRFRHPLLMLLGSYDLRICRACDAQ